MRHLLRRLTMFPVMLVGMIVIYPMGWMLSGKEEAKTICKLLLKTTWEGKI